MANNISTWNARIDKTLTVMKLGRQGILYEFILPYGANPMHYYEEAIDVKSHKQSEEYNNGKRLGEYQPIGDKRHFTFYQMNKMRTQGDWDSFLEDLVRRQNKLMLKKLQDAILRGVFDENR